MRLWGRGKWVGLEASPSLVRWVELDAARSDEPRLLGCGRAECPGGDPRWAVAELRAALGRRGRARRVAAALGGQEVATHLLRLPRLTRAERMVVVEGEARRERGALPDTLVVAHRVVSDILERGVPKDLVVAASAPRREVEDLLGFLSRAGLQPRFLVPTSLALFNVLVRMRGKPPGLALVEVEGQTGRVCIASGDQFRIYREFPLEAEEGETAEGGGAGRDTWLAEEMERSLLYFRQRFRGEGVSALILAGLEASPELANRLAERTGVPTEVFDPLTHLGLQVEWGSAREFARTGRSLAVPLGLALEARQRRPLDLLPPGLRIRRQLTVELGAAAAAVLVSVGALGWGGADLAAEANNFRRRTQALKVQEAALERGVRDAEKEATERGFHQARVQFLGRLAERASFWSALPGELASLAPGGVVFRALEIQRGEKEWGVSLKADVRGEDYTAAFADLGRFQQRVRALPFWRAIEFLPPVPQRGAKASGRTPAAPASEGISILEFEMRATLRLAPWEVQKGK